MWTVCLLPPKPVPPIKITLLASAHFVHLFPLLPWGCCLKDFATRGWDTLLKEHLRKLKRGQPPLPKIPRTLAICTLFGPYNLWSGTTMNYCHKWDFPLLCGPNFFWALSWHDGHGDSPHARTRVCAHPPEKEKCSCFCPSLDSGSPAPDVRETQAELKELGSQAEFTSVGNKPKEPLGLVENSGCWGCWDCLTNYSTVYVPPPPSQSLQGQQTCVTPAFHSLPCMKIPWFLSWSLYFPKGCLR